MGLSEDLVSQFVKVTNDGKSKSKEATVYGTTRIVDGKPYVKIDGADNDQLTPVETTVDVKEDERVSILIKDHTATITGNTSSPAARTGDVQELSGKLGDVVANSVTTEQLTATNAEIQNLKAENAEIKNLKADKAEIQTLIAKDAEIENLVAKKADIEHLHADYAKIDTLESTYAKIEALSAVQADINTLYSDKADINSLNTQYANIDFANIGEAAVNKLYGDFGFLKDVTSEDGVFTGELVAVTINGDLINANTLKADRLIVKGKDGLYYQLNVEAGATTTATQLTEEELQNGLHGTAIIAKSVTADKINVSDLQAFDATIGGFHIGSGNVTYRVDKNESKYETTDTQVVIKSGEKLSGVVTTTGEHVYQGTTIDGKTVYYYEAKGPHAIHSYVKDTVDNTTRGFYVDGDGQMNLGDAFNYIKYYKDTDGKYKLDIAAESLRFGVSGNTVDKVVQDAIDSAVGDIDVNVEVGGRNLLLDTSSYMKPIFDFEQSEKFLTISDYGKTKLTVGQTVTISFDYTCTNKDVKLYVYTRDDTGACSESDKYVPATDNKRCSITTTITKDGSLYCAFKGSHFASGTVSKPKLELGNIATDWTPAPEDVDGAINNAQDTADEAKNAAADAAKTASDYLTMTDEGLEVGYSITDQNVLIGSDGVYVRNGTTELSSFTEDTIKLGNNSKETKIELCGGAAYFLGKNNNSSISDGLYAEAKHFLLDTTTSDANTWSQCDIKTTQTGSGVTYGQLLSRHGNLYIAGFKTVAAAATANDDPYAFVNITATEGSDEGLITLSGTSATISYEGACGGSGDIRPWNIKLFSGAVTLNNSSSTVTLDHDISLQPTGVVLIFRDINATSGYVHTYFIPKKALEYNNNAPHCISWIDGSGNTCLRKIYVRDTTITGSDTYKNSNIYLTQVIGV